MMKNTPDQSAPGCIYCWLVGLFIVLYIAGYLMGMAAWNHLGQHGGHEPAKFAAFMLLAVTVIALVIYNIKHPNPQLWN